MFRGPEFVNNNDAVHMNSSMLGTNTSFLPPIANNHSSSRTRMSILEQSYEGIHGERLSQTNDQQDFALNPRPVELMSLDNVALLDHVRQDVDFDAIVKDFLRG